MKWSRRSHQMAAKLQEIERARKQAAEARLRDARLDAEQAEHARRQAEGELVEAELNWNGHVASHAFDVELGRAFASDVLRREQALNGCRSREETKLQSLEQEAERWRIIEAAVRSGERTLQRGARVLLKRVEERREHELGDRTSRSWFSR